MIYQKQLFKHDPENGIYGDCHRTAIACLLDLPAEEVPQFWIEGETSVEFSKRERAYLATKGLSTVDVIFDCELDQLLTHLESVNPHAYYILGGTSRLGCGHSVVGKGGKIVLDPSQEDTGIVGRLDGYYWVTYLVPISMIDVTVER